MAKNKCVFYKGLSFRLPQVPQEGGVPQGPLQRPREELPPGAPRGVQEGPREVHRHGKKWPQASIFIFCFAFCCCVVVVDHPSPLCFLDNNNPPPPAAMKILLFYILNFSKGSN